MALVYAKVYCKLKAGDASAREMAKANTGNVDKDALALHQGIDLARRGRIEAWRFAPRT